jgi:hypothetical protein
MRIAIRLPGYVSDAKTEQPVEDDFVLSSLDGWCYDGGNTYNYLSMDLVDHGIVGGIIRMTCAPNHRLEIVVDYWAPDILEPSCINQLRDETVGQLSDGIGEAGFAVALGGRECIIVPEVDKAPDVEIVHDGKPVPIPSRIARAARDGNMALLQEAVASGEEIDSLIQGMSGLHLAIAFGHVEEAIFLISKGSNPNLVVEDGDETPLHLCALSNALSDSDSAMVARALLSKGADKCLATASGATALSLAEVRKKTEMLRVLRESDPKTPSC